MPSMNCEVHAEHVDGLCMERRRFAIHKAGPSFLLQLYDIEYIEYGVLAVCTYAHNSQLMY